MALILLPILFLISTASSTKLTNIDYIGLGYDVFRGNPHTNLYDPGFKQSVMELTYNTVWHFLTKNK
jgi:hypothetical protein